MAARPANTRPSVTELVDEAMADQEQLEAERAMRRDVMTEEEAQRYERRMERGLNPNERDEDEPEPDDDDDMGGEPVTRRFAEGGLVDRVDAILGGHEGAISARPAGFPVEGPEERADAARRSLRVLGAEKSGIPDHGFDPSLDREIQRTQAIAGRTDKVQGRIETLNRRGGSLADAVDSIMRGEVAAPPQEGDAGNLDVRDIQARTAARVAADPFATSGEDVLGFGAPPEHQRAPYLGPEGVLTNMPPGAVAQSKLAAAGSAVMAARQAQENLRAQRGEDLDARDLQARALTKGRRFGLDEGITKVDLPPEDVKAVLADAEDAGKWAQDKAKMYQREVELVTPKDMDLFQKMVWSGVTSSGPTLFGIGVGVATRNPALGAAVAGAGGFQQQSGQTYLEAIDKGATHDAAMRSAIRQGFVEALDALPVGYALGTPELRRTFHGFLLKTLKTAGVEGATEAAQQALQDFDAYVTYNPNMTMGEAWENFVVAAGAGFILGTIIGGAGHAREPTRDELIARAIEDGVAGSAWTRPAEEIARDLFRPENAQMNLQGPARAAAAPQAIATSERRAAMTNRLEDGTLVEPKIEDGKPVPGVWLTAAGQLVEAPRADPLTVEPNAEWVTGGTTYPVEITGKGRAEGTARLKDGQEVPMAQLQMDEEARVLLGLVPPAEEKPPKRDVATDTALTAEKPATAAPAAPPKESPAAKSRGETEPPPPRSSRPEAAGPLPSIEETRKANESQLGDAAFKAALDDAVGRAGKSGQAKVTVAFDDTGKIVGFGSVLKLPQNVYEKIFKGELSQATIRVNVADREVVGVDPSNNVTEEGLKRLVATIVPSMSKREEARRAKLQRQAKDRKVIDEDRDGIVDAVIKLGGLDPQFKMDVTGDTKINPRLPWVGTMFQTPNRKFNRGRGLDEMSRALHERGWLTDEEHDSPDDGAAAVIEKIRAELNGVKQYSQNRSAEAMAQEERLRDEQEKERERDMAEEQAALNQDAEEAVGDDAPPLDGEVVPADIQQEGADATGIRAAIVDYMSQLDPDVAESIAIAHADSSESELLDALITEVQRGEERRKPVNAAVPRQPTREAKDQRAEGRKAGEDTEGGRARPAGATRAEGAERGTVRQDGGPEKTLKQKLARYEVARETEATAVKWESNFGGVYLSSYINGRRAMIWSPGENVKEFAVTVSGMVFHTGTLEEAKVAAYEGAFMTPVQEAEWPGRGELARKPQDRSKEGTINGRWTGEALVGTPQWVEKHGEPTVGLIDDEAVVKIVNAGDHDYRASLKGWEWIVRGKPREARSFYSIKQAKDGVQEVLDAAGATVARQPRAEYESDMINLSRAIDALDGIIASYRRIGATAQTNAMRELRDDLKKIRDDSNAVYYAPPTPLERPWFQALRKNLALHAAGLELENPFFADYGHNIPGPDYFDARWRNAMRKKYGARADAMMQKVKEEIDRADKGSRYADRDPLGGEDKYVKQPGSVYSGEVPGDDIRRKIRDLRGKLPPFHKALTKAEKNEVEAINAEIYALDEQLPEVQLPEYVASMSDVEAAVLGVISSHRTWRDAVALEVMAKAGASDSELVAQLASFAGTGGSSTPGEGYMSRSGKMYAGFSGKTPIQTPQLAQAIRALLAPSTDLLTGERGEPVRGVSERDEAKLRDRAAAEARRKGAVSEAPRGLKEVIADINALSAIAEKRQREAKDESIKGLRPTATDWMTPEEFERYQQLQAELAPLEKADRGAAAGRVQAKRAARREQLDLLGKKPQGELGATPLTGPEPPLLTTPEGVAPPREGEGTPVPTVQLKLFQRLATYNVKVDVTIAETGETESVAMPADQALREIDEKLVLARRLQECLRS